MELARVCALDVSPDCTSEISVLRSLRKGSLEALEELDELLDDVDELDESVEPEVSDASSVFRLAARLCAVVVSPLATALSRLWTSEPKLDVEEVEDEDDEVELSEVVDCVESEEDCPESPGGGGGGGPFSSLLCMELARVCALDVSPDCTSEISVLKSLRNGSAEELDELDEVLDESDDVEESDESVELEVSDASSVFRLAARLCAVVVSPLATALSRLWTSEPKLDVEEDDEEEDEDVELSCPHEELGCQP
jgi:DNA-binding transcriptional LysR family regulator